MKKDLPFRSRFLILKFSHLSLIVFLLFSCNRELLSEKENNISVSSLPSYSLKTRSIDNNLLNELRNDSLFIEMVRLMDCEARHKDYDSIKLTCNNNEQLLDSGFRAYMNKLCKPSLEHYRANKQNYPDDFLKYVLYESGNKYAPTKTSVKTRSIDDDMVFHDVTITPDYPDLIAGLMNSVCGEMQMIIPKFHRSSLQLIEHKSYCMCNDYYNPEEIKDMLCSVCYSRFGLGDMCFYFSGSLEKRIEYSQALEFLEQCASISYYFTYGEFKEDCRYFIFQMTFYFLYNPVALEYYIGNMNYMYNIPCYPSNPTGSGGGGGGGTTNPDPDPEEPCSHKQCETCGKYIRATSTRSTACPTHQWCDCEIVNIHETCPYCELCIYIRTISKLPTRSAEHEETLLCGLCPDPARHKREYEIECSLDRSPKELANAKDKFTSFFDNESDCMKTAQKVMDNFGLNGRYGDSQHVFQLAIDKGKNTALSYNPDKFVFREAINCIDIHLNNNRPIIVGVDYSANGNTNNPDGTDHFIVIIGRGSDSIGNYYTYMETGTDEPDKGYNPTDNRLYYNSATKEFYDDISSNRNTYNVTNVRPNDGKTYNTTAIKSTF